MIPKGMSKKDYVVSLFASVVLKDEYATYGKNSLAQKIVDALTGIAPASEPEATLTPSRLPLPHPYKAR